MEYHSFWHLFQILSFLEYLVFFGVSFALRIVKMVLWFINIHLALRQQQSHGRESGDDFLATLSKGHFNK